MVKINGDYINEYKKLIQSTNLQKGYQELIKFFRTLRIYLMENMPEYKFTGNMVENNMYYSYFQFTSEKQLEKGLKFVVVFIHYKFEYEVWLSGINRKTQINYYTILNKVQHGYIMSPNPSKFDYILKDKLFDEVGYNDCQELFNTARNKIIDFVKGVTRFI